MTDTVLGPPPVARPVVAKPSALPLEPAEYQQFLRTPRARWWRGLLAIVSLIVGYLVLSVIGTFAAIMIDVATGRASWEGISNGDVAVTPMLFLVNNLSLAALIPLSMLAQWAFFGQRPRWLSSVTGGFRWRWFARAAVVVVPLWTAYVIAMIALDPSHFGSLGADAVIMLIVVLLTTPLQAAGEEYGARGLINRSIGSWFRRPRLALVFGIVGSSLIFMVAHASTDPWLNSYYLVFGAVLAVLAWRTGGLEVPVLVHLVNNLLLMIPTALFGDLSQAFERGFGTGGPIFLLPMLLLVALIPLIEWWSRRNGVVRIAGADHA